MLLVSIFMYFLVKMRGAAVQFLVSIWLQVSIILVIPLQHTALHPSEESQGCSSGQEGGLGHARRLRTAG